VPYVLSTAWVKEGQGERLREWYRELGSRSDEAFETLDNEGIRQEVAFILDTPHGELLAVFLELDHDMKTADAAFFSSPFELDRRHMQVMDETTVEGSRGRVYAELQYALRNPKGGERSVVLPERV
jgi:Family of unknown function (DUF6176)